MKKKNVLEKCGCPHHKTFAVAIWSFVVFLLFELFVRSYNLYKEIPQIDILNHLFGGVALFTGFYWMLSLTTIKKKKLHAFLLSLAGGLFWELLETLEELVVYNPPHLQDIFFWDGFWDVILGLIGSIIGLTLINYLIKIKYIIK